MYYITCNSQVAVPKFELCQLVYFITEVYKIVKFDHRIYFFVSSFFLFYINLFIVEKVSAWWPRKCRKAISVVLFFVSVRKT